MRQLTLALLATVFWVGTAFAFDPAEALEDHFTPLADYAYSEIPAKPAETVLASLKGEKEGTVIQEIFHAADAFGIDRNFMMAVAKIESDFNPQDHTGSYVGLYQLSRDEFQKYGDGTITDPRDNAVAAAAKFTVEAAEFKLETHKKATASDLYLVHQQGLGGAVEHINHPDRPAWKSMCATDEGKSKGEEWCKRAIWENTLPSVKKIWKTVDDFTSGAFVEMWRERVNELFSSSFASIINLPPPSHHERRVARRHHSDHHRRHRHGH